MLFRSIYHLLSSVIVMFISFLFRFLLVVTPGATRQVFISFVVVLCVSVLFADGHLLFMHMNPREPAATARRPLRIKVLAKRAAERLVSGSLEEIRTARISCTESLVNLIS